MLPVSLQGAFSLHGFRGSRARAWRSCACPRLLSQTRSAAQDLDGPSGAFRTADRPAMRSPRDTLDTVGGRIS